jgi:carbamoyl-phosphate synthase large subunit
VPIARELQELGFGIMATYNTAAHLRKAGLTNIQSVLKVQEGRPNAGGFCAASDKPA